MQLKEIGRVGGGELSNRMRFALKQKEERKKKTTKKQSTFTTNHIVSRCRSIVVVFVAVDLFLPLMHFFFIHLVHSAQISSKKVQKYRNVERKRETIPYYYAVLTDNFPPICAHLTNNNYCN